MSVPASVAPFIGRSAELETLAELLRRERLITLTGPGGSGKTRLAQEVVRRFAGEVLVSFAELAAVDDPRFVGPVVQEAIGVTEQVGRSAVEVIATYVADDPHVLVLDNCEHVIEAAVELADFLLQACPRLIILATSRERLGLPGEFTWAVPTLATPREGSALDLESVSDCDAVRLFVDRARRVQAGFDVTGDNAATVGELVRRVDGIPLAIELAAAQTRVMSLSDIVEGLDDRFAVLSDPGRRSIPRHQTLGASIAWSHDLLDHRERAVFRKLSVFAGGFSSAAVEAVVTDGELDPATVRDTVMRLVDKSLVYTARLHRVATDEGEVRFAMLDTIRHYATERLDDAGETVEWRDRHLAWMRAVAQGAEPALSGSSQQTFLEELELEHANLQVAFDSAARSGRPDTVATMAADLNFFWKLHGHLVEGVTLLDGVLEGVDVAPDVARRVKWSLSDLLYWAGDFRRSHALASETLDEAERADDAWIVARCLWGMGNVECFTAPATAHERGRAAAAAARATGDQWCVAVSVQMQALTLRPDDDEIASLLAESDSIAIELDNPQLHAWNAFIATRQWVDRADWAAADEGYERGMAASRSISDSATNVMLTVERVNGLVARGRYEDASTALEECQAFVRGRGAEAYKQILELSAARISLATDPLRAEEQFAALADRRSRVRFGGLGGVALVSLVLDEPTVARAAAERALVAARALDKHELLTEQLLVSGLAALDEDPAQSERFLHEALEGLGPRSPRTRAELLEALAVAASRRQLDLDAARLLGAVRAWRRAHQVVEPVWAERWSNPAESATRSRAGGEAFDAALAEGASMTLHDATEFARRRRGARGRPAMGWASLTPSERRVADLAAEGLTNQAIAAQLFVGVGTVKTHLNHVYAKLGLTNRTELAALAVRRSGHDDDRQSHPHGQPV